MSNLNAEETFQPGAALRVRRLQRARDADGVLDDVTAMRACVAASLGRAPAVRTVMQGTEGLDDLVAGPRPGHVF